MNQKELIKTFMMLSYWKNTIWSPCFIQNYSAFNQHCFNLSCWLGSDKNTNLVLFVLRRVAWWRGPAWDHWRRESRADSITCGVNVVSCVPPPSPACYPAATPGWEAAGRSRASVYPPWTGCPLAGCPVPSPVWWPRPPICLYSWRSSLL